MFVDAKCWLSGRIRLTSTGSSCQLLRHTYLRYAMQSSVAAVDGELNVCYIEDARYAELWSELLGSVPRVFTFVPVIRPPDISVGGLIFYRDSSSSSFFLYSSKPAERNLTKIGHMLGSNCSLKTRAQNLGYTLPLQIGDPKTTFWGRLCNLSATLTAYIFGTKNDIDNRQVLDNCKGSPTSSQNVINFSPQTALNWTTIFTHPM